MNARCHQQSLDDQGGLANALPGLRRLSPIVLAFAMVAALAVDLALIPRASAALVRLIGRGRDAIINYSAAARYAALVGIARGPVVESGSLAPAGKREIRVPRRPPRTPPWCSPSRHLSTGR
jgi:hypothetical protein